MAHAHYARIPVVKELGDSNVYRLPFTDYRLPNPCDGGFINPPAAQASRGVAMVVSVVRDGLRGAWRSLSGGVAEPIAARKCRNNFSPSLSTH